MTIRPDYPTKASPQAGFEDAKPASQHTPGPWTRGNGDPGTYGKGYAIASGPFIVARVNGMGYPTGLGSHPVSDANARLIAAAPELLAALQALYEHCAMTHKHWGEGSNQKEADAAIAAGRAAIAKATGR